MFLSLESPPFFMQELKLMSYSVQITNKNKSKYIRFIRKPAGHSTIADAFQITFPMVQWRLLLLTFDMDRHAIKPALEQALKSREIEFNRQSVWGWITQRIASPALLEEMKAKAKELRELD